LLKFHQLIPQQVLTGAQNHMDARVGIDYTADFSDLQRESGFFERSLHLALPEKSKIATPRERSTIASLLSDQRELVWILLDPLND
jgi:hypothetical protein